MATPIFVDGFPAPVTAQDFLRYHLHQFPRLGAADKLEFIENSIRDVYAIYGGVKTIWDNHPDDEWFEKTQTCYRLLIAWYIADTNPMFLVGVPAMGGVPLSGKKIGPVSISYAESANESKNGQYQDLLGGLKSNPFGKMAYTMIRASGKRVILRNHKFV